MSTDTTVFRHFSTILPETGATPVFPVEATFQQSGDTLVVQVRCSFGVAPVVHGVLRDNVDWQNDDIVQLLCNPRCGGTSGYIFAVNSGNTQFDGCITKVNMSTGEWNYDWKSTVVRDSTSWTAQMWIPLKELVSGDVDSVDVQIVRGFTRRPSGVYEVVSLVPVPTGRSTVDLRSTRAIAFSLRAPSSRPRGHVIPYLRTQRTKGAPSRSLTVSGLDGTAAVGSNRIHVTVHPDFNLATPDSYSLDILENRLNLPENRPFFVECQEFTNTMLGTFYSKFIANDMDWGVQYTRDHGGDREFAMQVIAPLANPFTGAQGKDDYSCTMLAASRVIGNCDVHSNVTRLAPTHGPIEPRYHMDLEARYVGRYTGTIQLSQDLSTGSRTLGFSGETASLATGPTVSVSGAYVSPRYDYPLAYLDWGNNNLTTSCQGSYRWTFDRRLVPSVAVGTGVQTVAQATPSRALVRAGNVGATVECLPQTAVQYMFVYDQRPSTSTVNRYHTVSADALLHQMLHVNGSTTIGTYSRQRLTYRSLTLSANPVRAVALAIAYTYSRLGAPTNEFYTASVDAAVTEWTSVRCYYQRVPRRSGGDGRDTFNGLVQRYLTKRNDIYLMVNVGGARRQTSYAGRVGYEIAF
jgi:hypothetical protein